VRLVLDTCVLVSAFRSRTGASRQLINLLVAGDFEAVVNPALFFEYEDVLGRDQQIAAHGYTAHEVSTFLETFAKFTICVPQMHWQVKPRLPDAADELVLEAAINGFADAIVTFNLKHFLPAAREFGKLVLTPGSIIMARPNP
jgi:putative PIN family toxin of toxin-antitoxin system